MIQEIFNSNLFILIVSLLLICSILAVQFSVKVNAPSLLFFIALGMIAGSDILGIINFNNPEVAQLVGMMALVIILFDGGIQTQWKNIRPNAAPAVSLATVGVLITSLLVGVAAYLLFDLSWPEAILLGALVGSTDAAAVFAMLAGRNITNRLEATLEGESGANDPMAVFLTTAFISIVNQEGTSFFGFIGQFLLQMGGGLLIGLLIGKIASKSLYRINLSSSGLYPLLAISFAYLTYSVGSLLNASGLLAVYVAALVIGNSGLKQRSPILRFNEGFSWIAQIVLFVLLGLFVAPKDVFSFEIIVKGLILSLTLMLIARPVATFLSVAGMKFKFKEKLFLSWAGLRGAVPIVLALFPLLADLANSALYFNIVFFVVLTSTLVQGTTIPKVASMLGHVSSSTTNPIYTMDLLSIGKTELEVAEFQIAEHNNAANKKIKELNLPETVNITLILRKGDTVPPSGNLTLKPGDTLYMLLQGDELKAVEEILKAEEQ
ncbi:potassium/proton antiporter [Oceanobacillus manasiensis]|uniref:potassium/proton antiporter n=1 Tax=Oceanobacillus manasiensis TaxID=586413 RepID=UPI0005A68AD7|nr:potassium/proton antiporter [Oceanobacillus manasiensis]